MVRKQRSAGLALVAVFAAIGGTAWAMTQESNEPGPSGPVTPTKVLVRGSAPSGLDYTISRLEPTEFDMAATEALCMEIRTSAAATQGCLPVPDDAGRIDGQPFKPSMSLLGTDRFFTTLAPDGIVSMEVTVVGEGKTVESQPIDAGSLGSALVVKVGGPLVSSRNPESSRNYEVRLLDTDGNTVHQAAVSDPR